jgi:hypothetical protein
MALTPAEEKRIQNIEELLDQLKTLISNAASKRNLNRLLTLCNEELRRVNERQNELITKTEELIELARKLQ